MTDIICDENHHYWLDGVQEVPGVTQILQAQGISDFSFVPEKILEVNANFGTAAHRTCAYWDKGTLDMKSLQENEKTRALIPYLGQWQKFLKDYEVELYPGWIEKVSYCQKWRFGFTPDRIGKIKGKVILIDIKTGVPNRATEIQTAAYKLGIEEETGDKINERWVIYLGPEKYKIDNLDKDRSAYNRHKSVFLSCLNVYNYKKNGG